MENRDFKVCNLCGDIKKTCDFGEWRAQCKSCHLKRRRDLYKQKKNREINNENTEALENVNTSIMDIIKLNKLKVEMEKIKKLSYDLERKLNMIS